jgi:carbamate kinase
MLDGSEFAAGSMGPKVRAACEFVQRTGRMAAIGSIDDTAALVLGEAGTTVTLESAEHHSLARSGRFGVR